MKYQRKLHDVFAGKAVPARVRRAAFDVTSEADAEIAGLQAQVKALREELAYMVEEYENVVQSEYSGKQVQQFLANTDDARKLIYPQPESQKP